MNKCSTEPMTNPITLSFPLALATLLPEARRKNYSVQKAMTILGGVIGEKQPQRHRCQVWNSPPV